MPSIRWNEGLAYIAALHARTCSTESDECRNSKRFKDVGQNVGHDVNGEHQKNVTAIIKNIVDSWFMEHKNGGQADTQRLNYDRLWDRRHFNSRKIIQSQFSEDRWGDFSWWLTTKMLTLAAHLWSSKSITCRMFFSLVIMDQTFVLTDRCTNLENVVPSVIQAAAKCGPLYALLTKKLIKTMVFL